MISILRHPPYARLLSRLAAGVLLATAAGTATTLHAQALSADERRIVQYLDTQEDAMLALLEASVRISSPTEDTAGVRRMGALLRPRLEQLGFDARWIEMPTEMKRAGHLFAERTGNRGKRLLLIGHLDTVLPGGDYRREGDRVYGSGVGDMKGGNVILLYALQALHHLGLLDGTQIVVALTGDEEAPGKPFEISRRDFLAAARRSDVALGFEMAVKDTVTIARRGFSVWELEVQAATGHSSQIFSAALGSGAILETARILHEFNTRLPQEDGVTFSPSLIAGGIEAANDGTRASASGKINIIPQRVLVRGDLRFGNAGQLARAREAMQAVLTRPLPRTSATLGFPEEIPAMEATPANHALLAQLDQASRDLGFGKVEPCDPRIRGYGDISFVAPLLPGLDGLGARCEGAHTPLEYSDVSAMPELVKRAAVLIHRLTR